MKTKFYNKNGDLSLYGLSCGYTENKRTEKKVIKLFEEHGVFHVKTYDVNNTPGRVGCLGIADDEELIINKWETFDKLTDARKMFKNEFRTNKKNIMKAYEVNLKVTGGYQNQTKKVFVQAKSKNEIQNCDNVLKVWYRQNMDASECNCQIIDGAIVGK